MTEEEALILHKFFVSSPAGYETFQNVVARFLNHISDIRLLRLDEAERGNNPGFVTSIRYWVVTHVNDFFSNLTDIKLSIDSRNQKTSEKLKKNLPDPESEFT